MCVGGGVRWMIDMNSCYMLGVLDCDFAGHNGCGCCLTF